MQVSTNASYNSSMKQSSSSSSINADKLPWASALVWPAMFVLPLAMTIAESPLHYTKIFPFEWYNVEYQMNDNNNNASTTTTTTTTTTIVQMITKPKPLGLTLGILTVAIGQLLDLAIFGLFKFGFFSREGKEPLSIQTKGARAYQFMEGLVTHLSQPEGFVLLGCYLCGTWMYNLMPPSYYSFEGGIDWGKTFLCLVVQDGIQYAMHRLEHDVSPAFYKWSHKPHHRFTNPRLFDAFNGSLLDTVCMILIPLYITANLVHCNVWTYMAFGSCYANWLTLIHSEYTFPWDPYFHLLGFGTPADHHVHHAFFKFNFGHLFMWHDMLCQTYRKPSEFAPKSFNHNV